jgi:hypothetical protein
MQGFRTILVAVVSGLVTPWVASKTGIVLSEEAQAEVVGLVMAGVMVGMRAITDTPIFKKRTGEKDVP